MCNVNKISQFSPNDMITPNYISISIHIYPYLCSHPTFQNPHPSLGDNFCIHMEVS